MENSSATNPNKKKFIDSLTKGQTTNPSGTNVPGASNAPSNPYKQYLESLIGDNSYKSALEKYQSDAERLAGIQSEGESKELEARRKYEQLLNQSGGLKSGAEQSAAVSSRGYNQELADLALRESAASRTAGVSQSYLQNLLSAGKELSDLTLEEQKLLQKETPAPFELSPGQARYEYDPESRQYKAIASLPSLPKSTTGTVTERQAQTLGSYAQGFQPGQTLPDGTPAIDQNGFITPVAWKVAINDAVSKGVNRQKFIQQYGNMLYGENLDAYQLTPAEKSIIKNTTKISSEELDPALQALLDSIE